MMRILPLTGAHDRLAFDCGRDELNDWLKRIARQHQDKGLSRTFVATEGHAPTRPCGYYALTLAEVEHRHLPEAWRRKLPRRIPAVRLGRLAVDRACQKKGLGELLLVDALLRARRIHVEAGVSACSSMLSMWRLGVTTSASVFRRRPITLYCCSSRPKRWGKTEG